MNALTTTPKRQDTRNVTQQVKRGYIKIEVNIKSVCAIRTRVIQSPSSSGERSNHWTVQATIWRHWFINCVQ